MPAWGFSRATFVMLREYYSHECLSGGGLGGGVIFILRPLALLLVSLGLFDSSYSSRTRWIRLQMISPCSFFSLVITLPPISHCCLPPVLQVSIWLSTLLIPIWLAFGQLLFSLCIDTFHACVEKCHWCCHETFSFCRLWPILFKKNKMLAYHKSPVTFSGLPKYPVFLHNDFSE